MNHRRISSLDLGQDIAEYGGVFKVTEGFVEKFGRYRVRNTPLCESANYRHCPWSFDQRNESNGRSHTDFVTCGFNQIVNNRKTTLPLGRKPAGSRSYAYRSICCSGSFSQPKQWSLVFHTPGLKIAYPAFPEDAKGLLCQSFEDPNPVLFFEHKALYRSVTSQVPAGFYTIPFGKRTDFERVRNLLL